MDRVFASTHMYSPYTSIGFCGTGRKKIPFNQFKAIRSLLLVQAEDKLSTLIFFYTRSPVVFDAPRRHHTAAAATATADISIIIMSDAIKVIYIFIHNMYVHIHRDNLAAFVARRLHGGLRALLFSVGCVSGDGARKKKKKQK